MEPFFFTDDDKQLLGIYHPPGVPGTGTGIIICPPILGDFMRTHGCLRQLAIELARSGLHVLRFDYYGTGDSQDDIQDASIESWQSNIVVAANELREIAGVSRIAALGVRLGATLAVFAAGAARLDSLFLWDPIVDGESYVEALNNTYRDLLSSHEYFPESEEQKATSCTTGYDLSSGLVQSIGDLRLSDAMNRISAEATIIITDRAKYDAGECSSISENRLFVDHECNWGTFSENAIFGRLLIPQIVQRVTS